MEYELKFKALNERMHNLESAIWKFCKEIKYSCDVVQDIIIHEQSIWEEIENKRKELESEESK